MAIENSNILNETLHYSAGAYFNNAGASLMPCTVVARMTRHLNLESELGAYGAAAAVADELTDLYTASAQLFGCTPGEIALTEGHSAGWREVVGAMHFSPGDRILVGRSEWGGNFAALWHIAKRTGAVVEVIPSNSFGEVCLEKLASMLDTKVKLISLTWLPANGGLINPAAEVGKLAKALGVPYVVDAAQAVGQLPVDVVEIGCDVLTAPGRKWLRGPRGTGLMYVRSDFVSQVIPWMVDQHSAPFTRDQYRLREDARRFETSEACVAARLGLRVAVRGALGIGLEAIRDKVSERAETLRQGLDNIPGVALHDLGRNRSGLVSFTVNGVSADEVKSRLAASGVEVAVNGIAFTPLDMRARGLAEIVRASPHIYTSNNDIECLLRAVEDIVEK